MAVYTPVDDAALKAFLREYALGEPRAFKGIAEGVENTNYYLETSKGRYILTLFEGRADAADLPWFIGLTRHLAEHGFPCPLPVPARGGEALGTLCGRPAAIVTFLEGLSPRSPGPAHCRALGTALAELHAAAAAFAPERANPLDAAGSWKLTAKHLSKAESLQKGLPGRIRAETDDALARAGARASLPRGVIHADLFPDNAFFLEDRFTGAIDFYFACTDALAYDLAVCLLAWAFEDQDDGGARFHQARARALLEGYEEVRALTPEERAALPGLCQDACLRFFATRLADWGASPEGSLVRPKNPLPYAARLAWIGAGALEPVLDSAEG